jgi:hypothetical protein
MSLSTSDSLPCQVVCHPMKMTRLPLIGLMCVMPSFSLLGLKMSVRLPTPPVWFARFGYCFLQLNTWYFLQLEVALLIHTSVYVISTLSFAAIASPVNLLPHTL